MSRCWRLNRCKIRSWISLHLGVLVHRWRWEIKMWPFPRKNNLRDQEIIILNKPFSKEFHFKSHWPCTFLLTAFFAPLDCTLQWNPRSFTRNAFECSIPTYSFGPLRETNKQKGRFTASRKEVNNFPSQQETSHNSASAGLRAVLPWATHVPGHGFQAEPSPSPSQRTLISSWHALLRLFRTGSQLLGFILGW